MRDSHLIPTFHPKGKKRKKNQCEHLTCPASLIWPKPCRQTTPSHTHQHRSDKNDFCKDLLSTRGLYLTVRRQESGDGLRRGTCGKGPQVGFRGSTNNEGSIGIIAQRLDKSPHKWFEVWPVNMYQIWNNPFKLFASATASPTCHTLCQSILGNYLVIDRNSQTFFSFKKWHNKVDFITASLFMLIHSSENAGCFLILWPFVDFLMASLHSFFGALVWLL